MNLSAKLNPFGAKKVVVCSAKGSKKGNGARDPRDSKGLFQLLKQYPVTLETVKEAHQLTTDTTFLGGELSSKEIYSSYGVDGDMVEKYLPIVNGLETSWKNDCADTPTEIPLLLQKPVRQGDQVKPENLVDEFVYLDYGDNSEIVVWELDSDEDDEVEDFGDGDDDDDDDDDDDTGVTNIIIHDISAGTSGISFIIDINFENEDKNENEDGFNN